jgi:hypothetical protein
MRNRHTVAVLCFTFMISPLCWAQGDLTGNNLIINGPSPWVDVKAQGAKGDGKSILTGTVRSGNLSVLVDSSASGSFLSTDCTGGTGCTGTANKVVAVDTSPFPAPQIKRHGQRNRN